MLLWRKSCGFLSGAKVIFCIWSTFLEHDRFLVGQSHLYISVLSCSIRSFLACILKRLSTSFNVALYYNLDFKKIITPAIQSEWLSLSIIPRVRQKYYSVLIHVKSFANKEWAKDLLSSRIFNYDQDYPRLKSKHFKLFSGFI